MRKFLILLVLSAMPAAASAACFDVSRFEPSALSGTLSARVFAGPPGYEDVDKGDAPEPGYVLKLAQPICLTGDADFTDPSDMFDEVQLVSRENTAAAMEALDGKAVTVTLSGHIPAHTGHHHRPLVAWVDEIVADAVAAPEESKAIATVRAFYLALAAGDGKAASSLVIEEKRKKGPFSAKALGKFYGSLAKPVELLDIEEVGKNDVAVRYRYATRSGTCDGGATVRTTERQGRVLISGISAKNGC